MADWAELRVHGVSGTPPRSMLGTDAFTRIDLEGRSAAYRADDGNPPGYPGPPGRILEAFHWGDHTSGSRDQALWLLLLPFGMANASQFMLPAAKSRPARALRAACGGALRVLALVLTVLFALAVAVGLLDLLMWQWLADGAWLPDEIIPVVLAVGVGLCVGVVVLLSRLGRAGRTVTDVVMRRHPLPADREALANPLDNPGALPPAEPPAFSSPDFFAGDPDAPTLRRLHVAAGLLVVASLAWRAADSLTGGVDGLADTAAWGTTVLLGTVAILVLLLGNAPGADLDAPDVGRSAWAGAAAWAGAIGLGAAALSALGAAVALVLVDGPDVPSGSALPGVDGLVWWCRRPGSRRWSRSACSLSCSGW